MDEVNVSHELESKEKILIVDDTPDNLRLLSAILGEQGYEVRKALNGNLALKACQRVVPDLIFLDINMPDLNGYEVCQALKAQPQTCDIPIIFISALDDILDKVKAFECGGKDYITKPFQEVEILSKAKQLLQLRSCQRQLQAYQSFLQEEIQLKEKLKAALEFSETKNNELLTIMPDSIFWVNHSGSCLDYHLTPEQRFLKSNVASDDRTHFIGKHISEFLLDSFGSWLSTFIEQPFLSNEVKRGEYLHPLNDNEQYNYEVRAIQTQQNQILLLIHHIAGDRRQ